MMQIDSQIVANISSQQSDINRLSNVEQSTRVIEQLKSILSTWQQVGYHYSFVDYKVNDPIKLSQTLRRHAYRESCLQANESNSTGKMAKERQKVVRSVMELQNIKQIQIKIDNVKEQLIKHTSEKFDDAISNLADMDELSRNIETMNECIIVFFNLEILREQIQNKVNQTLKLVSNSWKKAVTDI